MRYNLSFQEVKYGTVEQKMFINLQNKALSMRLKDSNEISVYMYAEMQFTGNTVDSR